MRDAGQDASTPVMDRMIGVYSCPSCGGKGYLGMSDAEALELHKALKRTLRRKSRRDSGT
jgi:Ribonuclease G/E